MHLNPPRPCQLPMAGRPLGVSARPRTHMRRTPPARPHLSASTFFSLGGIREQKSRGESAPTARPSASDARTATRCAALLRGMGVGVGE